MSIRNRRTRRVSGQQLDVLWDFLNSHRDIANAYNRSLQAKEHSRRKWTEIADALNAQGDGAHKEWNEWSKYWVDYKSKLKGRVSALRSAQSATGGGPSTERPLSDMENKFLQILGEDFGLGLPGVRVEPFPENARSTATVEDSPASESILMTEPLILDPVPSVIPEVHPVNLEPHQAVPNVTPTADPIAHSLPSAPPPATTTMSARITAEQHPRCRRYRREQPMSQEAARRALVESSRLRAEAAVRTSEAAERSSRALETIQTTLQAIERFIRGASPRAGE